MTIRNRTTHAVAIFLSVPDVADRLGISRWTVMRMARAGRLPGAERMYAHSRGERWHVRAETFFAWQRAMQDRVG